MTEFGIPDPLVLEGDISKNYKNFLISFNKYSDNMGLKEMPEKTKITLFLTAIGKEARELYGSFNLPLSATLEKIMGRYQSFCESYRSSEVYYSYKFYKRVQLKNESFNSFLKSINALARKCGFTEERAIRDKVVMGIRNQSIRTEIFIKGFKKLDDIIDFCRRNENKMTSEATQSVPVIKTENVDKAEKKNDDKEVKNDKEQNLNDAVTSSQEIPSQASTFYDDTAYDDESSEDDDNDVVLEKGEVSTSTSRNNLLDQLHAPTKQENKRTSLPDKDENAANDKKEEGNHKLCTENCFSLPEVIVIDSSDDENEPEPRTENRENEPEPRTENRENEPRTEKPQKSDVSLTYLKCGQCGGIYERIAKLEAHLKICVGGLSKNEGQRGNGTRGGSISFPGNTSTSFSSDSSPRKPKKIGNDDKECPKCFRVFGFPCRLKEHLRGKKCSERFSERSLPNKSIYKCGHCHMKFKQKINFMRHQKMHEKKLASQIKNIVMKSNKCYICSRVFSSMFSLNRHIRTVHKKGSSNPMNKIPNIKLIRKENGNLSIDTQIYECDLCPRKYKHQRSLYTHQKQVHRKILGNRSLIKEKEKKQYHTCVVCFKKFEHVAHYREHVVTHQNNDVENILASEKEKYECLVCDKKLPNPENLHEHMRTHT